MDFFKKSCKELCTRLWKDISNTQKRITTTDELDKFIEAKFGMDETALKVYD